MRGRMEEKREEGRGRNKQRGALLSVKEINCGSDTFGADRNEAGANNAQWRRDANDGGVSRSRRERCEILDDPGQEQRALAAGLLPLTPRRATASADLHGHVRVCECVYAYALQPRVQEVILISLRTGDACEGHAAPVIIILIRIINISDGGREAV
ncbi:hypothetical protein AOLI_G00021510 [Acnodon oligacanthus]